MQNQLFHYTLLFSILVCLHSCTAQKTGANIEEQTVGNCDSIDSKVSAEIIVLGIAQDAGYPQANCKKSCCTEIWADNSKRKMVSCLGLRDYQSNKVWLFDATPDFKDQLHLVQTNDENNFELGGIFLTHAHIGHYTGLMHLGREAMGASNVPVYAMPRIKSYLQTNGPWSQLVELKNIVLNPIQDKDTIRLGNNLYVIPLEVPHRDEFSETVGYVIGSLNKKVLFIPDIDKWHKWQDNINDYIEEVDVAFLDGTFYQNGEIWGRDMSQIPHPFIVESMDQFSPLSIADKSKIHFIHFNHTNPLLRSESEAYEVISKLPYKIAHEGQTIRF